MSSITGRALHFVLKIGDRSKNSHFFRNILGMKVLRHEEFKEGCEAQCNGPYDNRWSKTMIGYGEESTHFVIELTYNYGVKNYEIGNEFGGITIKSLDIMERVIKNNYPYEVKNNLKILTSPDGYKFYINEVDDVAKKDIEEMKNDITEVILHSSNLDESKKYWYNLLSMNILAEDNKSLLLSYGNKQISLRLLKITETINRAKAYGRIAFAVPIEEQKIIDEKIKTANATILTPLIVLDTPGKASVQVIILADPDGHEICFVDDKGFDELSKFEIDGNKNLDKYIKKDPFEDANADNSTSITSVTSK